MVIASWVRCRCPLPGDSQVHVLAEPLVELWFQPSGDLGTGRMWVDSVKVGDVFLKSSPKRYQTKPSARGKPNHLLQYPYRCPKISLKKFSIFYSFIVLLGRQERHLSGWEHLNHQPPLMVQGLDHMTCEIHELFLFRGSPNCR